MAEMKPHLAITVSDVDRSVPFYRALLDHDPAKLRPGYAKFEPARDPDGTPWEVFTVLEDVEHDARRPATTCCA